MMKRFSASPAEMILSFLRNRSLVIVLVKREVLSQYRGSLLGIFWTIFNPVLMLLVYTFVFGTVFKSRWNTAGDSKAEFALVLYLGLLMFNIFAGCINSAPALITNNVNYVKKVVFPLEVLPWVSLGAALFHWIVGIIVWVIFYICLFGVPHATALLIPVVLIPFALLTMGLMWILASLGVYLRDISQFITIVTAMLMFLAPVFYPLTAVPEKYQILLLFNPVTPAIDEARDLLLWGNVPDAGIFLCYLMISTFVACIGFAWFQKSRKGFADVI